MEEYEVITRTVERDSALARNKGGKKGSIQNPVMVSIAIVILISKIWDRVLSLHFTKNHTYIYSSSAAPLREIMKTFINPISFDSSSLSSSESTVIFSEPRSP